MVIQKLWDGIQMNYTYKWKEMKELIYRNEMKQIIYIYAKEWNIYAFSSSFEYCTGKVEWNEKRRNLLLKPLRVLKLQTTNSTHTTNY